MSIQKKFHMALDETRLLILASQILFGFQLESIFQEEFDKLPRALRAADATGLLLMVLALGFLITPQCRHRIAESGLITGRLRIATSRFAEAALLPFSMSLGIDLFLVVTHAYGETLGYVAGAGFFCLAIAGWYVGPFLYRFMVLKTPLRESKRSDLQTPLSEKIDQMLTEARLALPGAQALLGFQLIVTLSRAFGELPWESRVIHGIALILVAMSMVFLVAPAAIHRIAFDGEDDERFFDIGSWLVGIAPLPLLLAIAGDVYVAIGKALGDNGIAIAAAVITLLMLAGLWYAYPLALRWIYGVPAGED